MRCVFAIVISVAGSLCAPAQVCEPDWLLGDGVAGLDGEIYAASTFDPDGDGPSPELLIVGGLFGTAGDVRTNNIAAWDGETWFTLGDGVNGAVRALAMFDDGSGPALYAGGEFTEAGGLPADRIARWDGQSWTPLGGGVNGSVETLAAFDGALFAGGAFTEAGGQPASRIARWNGQLWEQPDGGANGQVHALAVFDGALFAGGAFTQAGGAPASRIARWDGDGWTALGIGVNGPVFALLEFDDGDGPALFAGGQFTQAGDQRASNFARWDGDAWTTQGSELSGIVRAFAAFDDGSGPALYAGGTFIQAESRPARRVAKWDGESWSALGSEISGGGTNDAVEAFALFDGALHIVGVFTEAGEQPASRIARWNGAWAPVSSGTDGGIEALAVFEGALYAGGLFTQTAGEPASRVAKWDGASWSPLAGGLGGPVFALAEFDDQLSDGPVLHAGGLFTQAGGAPANNIAKWDGAAWSPLGGGVGGPVYALAVFDDMLGGSAPDLYAGGAFTQAGQPARYIARWDGQQWSPVGGAVNGGGMNDIVDALAVFDGALYVGGRFTKADGLTVNYIARWDGQFWSALSNGMNGPVYALAVFDDGSGAALYAAGDFTQAGGQPANSIARWNGQSWSPLADTTVGGGVNGSVEALTVFNDGSGPALYAGGGFTHADGQPANRIARWNGQSWSAVGEGVNDRVAALTTFDPDGPSGPAAPRLFAGGQFTTAGDQVSAFLAQLGVDTSVWADPAGGQFNAPDNWLCARAPSAFDNLVFDAALAGYNPSSFTITFGAPPGPRHALTLRARTDVATLNLSDRALEITGGTSTTARPAITIGELPDLAPTLTIRNTTGASAMLSAASLSIADQPTIESIFNRLTIQDAGAFLDIEGDASIGRRGDRGELFIQTGAIASIGGDISIGTDPGASGEIRVQGADATLLHSDSQSSMTIGQSGRGELRIIGTDPSRATAAASMSEMESLVLGSAPTAEGRVRIENAGASWSVASRRFIVGNRGEGSLEILSGASLETTTSESVDIALQPGSVGAVSLRGAGSNWREQAQSITIHDGGDVFVGSGATVKAVSIDVRPGGLLRGDGAVGADDLFTNINNAGDVAPSDSDGEPATMILTGDYQQIDSPPGQSADRAGRLITTLSPKGASRLEVRQGAATIRGGLVIDAADGVTLENSADLSFLSADFGLINSFDVVFVAGKIRNDRGDLLALAVRYPQTRAGQNDASLTTIATVAIDVEGAIIKIDSGSLITDGVLADLNGDDLNDLAITVQSNPGSVVILFNAGFDNGQWLGFTSPVTYDVGPDPSSIAAGDLNNDAFNDLVVTNAGDDTAILLSHTANGSFATSLLTNTGAAPSAVLLHDFDGDTLTDVAIAAQDDNTITIYRNAGGVGGAWAGVLPQTPVAVGQSPIDLAVIDQDDDKDLDDIASINAADDQLQLLNNNEGALTAAQIIPVGANPSFLLAADLDNDAAQSLDLITADAQGQSLSIVLNEPGPDFAPSVQVPLGFAPRFVAAADLDGDGDRDLAVLAASGAPANEIAILRNDLTEDGDLILAQDDPIVLDAPVRFLIAGDIDGDAADDLIAVSEPSTRGGASEPTFRHTMRRPRCPGDATGDLIVNFSDLNAVLVGYGFAGPDLPGDVDGDGVVGFSDLNAILVAFGTDCLN